MTKNEILALAEAARHLGEEAAKVDPVCGYLATMIAEALREATEIPPRIARARPQSVAASIQALTAAAGVASE